MFDLFEDEGPAAAAPATAEMVAVAQAELGVRLPQGYVDILSVRNGGLPRNRRCVTPFRTSWADDHFEVAELYGVGGANGIDGRLGSGYLVAEWGYPAIGVVLFATPSGGHDAVMLDYSRCGSQGEPSVAYIDEDRRPRTVADTFDTFITSLLPQNR